MIDTFQNGVISLIRSALSGKKEDIPDDFDWRAVVKIAQTHQLHAMLYYGVVNAGAQPPAELRSLLETNAFKSLAVDRNQVYAIGELLKAFAENEIDHMPLKGILLKQMYPKSELRAMSDADILIKPEQYDRVRPIMQKLGYVPGVESDHEYVWVKENVLTVELHKRLIPSYNRDYFAYYGDGWQLAKRKDGTRYRMTDEDQLIYLVTHFAKHYRDGGIGIRHFVDLQIFLSQKPDLDQDYITGELKKLQLDAFYQNIRTALRVWFEGAAGDDVTDFITARVFGSGSYGTPGGRLLSAATRVAKASSTGKSARAKRKLWMVFPPLSQMTESFPVLEKCPLLLPFLWVFRWFRALLFRRKTIAKMQNEMKYTTVDRVENYQQELHFVGLDFNFKE